MMLITCVNNLGNPVRNYPGYGERGVIAGQALPMSFGRYSYSEMSLCPISCLHENATGDDSTGAMTHATSEREKERERERGGGGDLDRPRKSIPMLCGVYGHINIATTAQQLLSALCCVIMSIHRPLRCHSQESTLIALIQLLDLYRTGKQSNQFQHVVIEFHQLAAGANDGVFCSMHSNQHTAKHSSL